jgi:hypothetical protein
VRALCRALVDADDPLTFVLRQDDGLERFNLGLGAANIGVMFVRKAALELVDEWNRILDRDDKVWDQNAFNDLFRRGTGQELPNRLFMAFDVRAPAHAWRRR